MIISEILDTLMAELQDKLITTRNYLVRQIQFPETPHKIQVAIGMRRVGKTCLLLQVLRGLISDQKLPRHRILYLNFEDDRLLPCAEAKLRSLLEGFYQHYPENHDHLCYLFLDEIQNVDGWATVIRRFFDTKKVKIYLSGSSAKLLSKEIASSLRGRALTTEVWPYSFEENLIAQGISVQTEHFGEKWTHQYMHHLKHYLDRGGFPETFWVPEINRRQLLQDYVEVVIMRDLIERYQISNIALVKYMIHFLLKNTGTSFSVHKLANDVKSQGLLGARNTIYDYLSYIEDAYLAFAVPLFSESVRKTHSNPRKIYSIDSGLTRAFSFSLQKNYGHLFENLVFLDFKRKGHKIFYYLTQERYEIDFLTEDPLGVLKLHQVVWDTSDPKTIAREERALHIAEKELQIEGEIITPERYLQQICTLKS